MNNLIMVNYRGGLGNNLFDIAAAIVYAEKCNRRLVFEHYPTLPNLDKFSLSRIGMTYETFSENMKDISDEDIDNGVILPYNKNIKLTVFFQQYKRFDHIKDHVFDIMGLSAIRSSVIAKIKGLEFRERRGLFEKSGSVTISLHIRRGDYEELKCYFILLNEYYYKNAILKIVEKINPGTSIKILCFYEKNSTVSCTQIVDKLKGDPDLNQYPLEYYHFNRILDEQDANVSDIEEIAIMSHCDHHIIANSTYSWWGAYLNPDPNKMVSYPNEYFNHQLYYLSNDGLKVDGWMSVDSWNPWEWRCDCR